MATANKSSHKELKNRPVHDIRMGRIRAAIWQNETETGTRHNVTISRLYKDGDDWKDSTSFGRDDLPLVAKVCDQAHSWIFEHGLEKIFEHGSEKANGNNRNSKNDDGSNNEGIPF